jgi:predicted HicB family RNase H-like nuclease
MHYKGYYGSVYFDEKQKLLYGKLEFIRDLINFEATDTKTLVEEFHNSVDEYLEDCIVQNKIPDKPFKGSFNVRIDPELHRKASIYAIKHDNSLNRIIGLALEEFIFNHSS